MSYYERQIKLSNFGNEGQERLTEASALIIGMGGLGCPVAQNLAQAGLGYLHLVDFDTIEESNLHRQGLYTIKDIGQPKVAIAQRRLSEMNPNISIDVTQSTIESSAQLFDKSWDLVLDCTDQMDSRLFLADACLESHTPLVSSAVYGWEGQIHVYRNFPGDPTLRTLFPNRINPESVPDCRDTGVLGVLTNTIGSMMANEAIVGLVDGFSIRLSIYDGRTRSIEHLALPSVAPTIETGGNANLGIEVLEDTKFMADKQLIDVRTKGEYDEFNLGGINIPLDQIIHYWDQFDNPVFLCSKGIRSAKALAAYQKTFEGRQAYHITQGLRTLKLS